MFSFAIETRKNPLTSRPILGELFVKQIFSSVLHLLQSFWGTPHVQYKIEKKSQVFIIIQIVLEKQ